MVRPSQRVEAARKTVTNGIMNVRQACEAFKISYCCYHYKRKLSDDNVLIADLLLGLTQSQKNWGFGLCFFVSQEW